MTDFFTRKGDDGTTGRLGPGRLTKSDLQIDALGCLDEANSALGFLRSVIGVEDIRAVLLKIQRELYQIMGEIAALPENAGRFRVINPDHVAWLENQVGEFGNKTNMPRDFIVPGDTIASAAADLARTAARRAERRVVALDEKIHLENPAILSYLNRLSSLCFVLEIYAIQHTNSQQPTLAKDGTS
ncbi:MAG TPA: cob(I)yrinic acid a,c-diamide adenosyltransferase [Anaerolineaceae bacterium]